MVEGIVNSVIALAKSLKENGILTVLALILVVGLFGALSALSNSTKIDALVAPSPHQESYMLDTSFDADALINAELDELREDTGAGRSLVRQFTNGNHNLAGIPFAFVITTHVSIRQGVTAPSFDRYPTSSMNNTMRLMFKGEPKCIMQDVEEMRRDAAYVAYLAQHGVVKAFSCPLVTEEGIPMGFIGIGYVDAENQRLSDGQTLIMVKAAATNIARNLAKVRYQAEEVITPWWQFW